MTGPVPTIRPATHEDLQHLAALLAPEPLFSAYDLSAEALEKRWCDALTRGEGILVACPEAQPVGLCWFSPSGAFALGAYLRLIAISSKPRDGGPPAGGLRRRLRQAHWRVVPAHQRL